MIDSSQTWDASLQQAIADLQRSTADQPRNVDELHAHMRMRTLQLIAGDERAAFHPIPGAAPAQQDFWAQQLFAMATYLDSKRLSDEKQRAAAALVHLDEARGRLAELATLQVRNAALVTEVTGFGAYAPVNETRFRAGEEITLYAEIENLRSQSTVDGYQTVLSTSYQVVDETGRRVDGAQFPDVEDVCRTRRRDFHMQYGIALPTRIYPGPYELQLIVTDQLSNKIGQASVALEIIE
ncbi:MAG: hypothetical protein AAF961_08850 [Planctomycetota bacterium]